MQRPNKTEDISYTAFIISSVINHVIRTEVFYYESLKLFVVLQCFTNVSKFAFLSSSLLRCRSSQCEQGVEVCTLQGQRHDWGRSIIVAVFTLYRAVQLSMNPAGSQGICFLMASESGTVHAWFFTSPTFHIMKRYVTQSLFAPLLCNINVEWGFVFF